MGSVSVHGVSATHVAHECDVPDVRAIGPMHYVRKMKRLTAAVAEFLDEVGTRVRRRWPPLYARVCLRAGRPVGPLLGSHSRCCNTPVSFLTAVEPRSSRTPPDRTPTGPITNAGHPVFECWVC
jgi:hypothetical protein